jgi:Immunity protein 50
MSASDWANYLDEPEAIRHFFTSSPPLESCDLFYFHIDERERGVTMGFEHHQLPDRTLPEWVDKGFNACEFFLTFTATSKLRISGWQHTGMNHYAFTSLPSGGLSVTIRGDNQHIEFRAESVRLSRLRAFTTAAR